MKFKYFDYHQLVQETSEAARKAPQRHFISTASWAMLGAIVYALLVLAVLAISVATIYACFFTRFNVSGWGYLIPFIVLLACFYLLQTLLVRSPPLEGVPLDSARYPELFEVIEGIRLDLECPKVHGVWITFDINASMYRRARFIPFGPKRNYLSIGLPLYTMLSTAQMRAVIAHELAHLSKRHGNHWLFYVRSVWFNFLRTTQGSVIWWAVREFAQWYLIQYSAKLSVLAREQEFEADQIAAGATSSEILCSALKRIAVLSTYFHDELWPSLHEKMVKVKSPDTFHFYNHLKLLFSVSGRAEEFELFQQKSMLRKAAAFDMHPSLADRLTNLNGDGTTPPPKSLTVTNASHVFLKKDEGIFSGAFDLHFRAEYKPLWVSVHKSLKSFEQIRSVFTLKYKDIGFKHTHDLWYLGQINEFLCNQEEALRFYEEALSLLPENTSLQFAIARVYLERCRESGDIDVAAPYAEQMQVLSEAESRFELTGKSLLHEYHLLAGNAEQADEYFNDLLKTIDLLNDPKDPYQISINDHLTPHGFDDDELTGMRRILRGYPMIRKAYLVRWKKKSKDLKGDRYLLIIRLKRRVELDTRAIEWLKDELAAIFSFYGDVSVGCTGLWDFVLDAKVYSVSSSCFYRWKKGS